MLTTVSVKQENNTTWCPPQAASIEEALQKLIGMSSFIPSHNQKKTMKDHWIWFSCEPSHNQAKTSHGWMGTRGLVY